MSYYAINKLCKTVDKRKRFINKLCNRLSNNSTLRFYALPLLCAFLRAFSFFFESI